MTENNPTSDSKFAVSVNNLTKAFSGKTILSGVFLDVSHGESLVIIGLSGSGKSVFLKHLIGLEKPDSGAVEVFGVRIEKLSGEELFGSLRRARIGVVFQEPALFDSMSIGENLLFPMSLDGVMSAEEAKEEAKKLLQEVAVFADTDAMPSTLSGGMRKRVALARALAVKPKLLLYDEPTSGLDPVTSDRVNALIKKVNDRIGNSFDYDYTRLPQRSVDSG